jgi:hypothetical protein
LAHARDQFVDIVLAAREIRSEIGGLGTAQTGPLSKQIDDCWVAGIRGDNAIDLGWRAFRSFDPGGDNLGVCTRQRKAHGDAYSLVFAKMAGDLGQQKVVEQGHVLLLLIGRGASPEAAQAELRSVVHVHRRVNDCLQLLTLLLGRSWLLTIATN